MWYCASEQSAIFQITYRLHFRLQMCQGSKTRKNVSQLYIDTHFLIISIKVFIKLFIQRLFIFIQLILYLWQLHKPTCIQSSEMFVFTTGLIRDLEMLYVFLKESEDVAQSCVCRTHGCQVGVSMHCSLCSDGQGEGVCVHLQTGTRPMAPSDNPSGPSSDSQSRQ